MRFGFGPGVRGNAILLGVTNMPHLRTTLQTLAATHLHWRAGSLRSFISTRKEAGLFCGSFLWKGVVFAYVGSNQTLKDLKG